MTHAEINKWVYWIGGVFIGLLGLSLWFEQFWILALPVALGIIGLALFRLDWSFMLITILTPVSVAFEDLPGGLGLSLPTEPLIFGLMLVFFYKVFFDGEFDGRVLMHPIAIAILLNLGWVFITIFSSEEPVVSIKFFLSRLWYVVGFFFVATQIFRNPNNIRKFLWFYIVPLALVGIYTVSIHATHGFASKPAHWVMQPVFQRSYELWCHLGHVLSGGLGISLE